MNPCRVSLRIVRSPEALMRLTACLHRRRYEVHSLAVTPSADVQLQDVSLVLDVGLGPVERVVQQLDQLIEVVSVEAG